MSSVSALAWGLVGFGVLVAVWQLFGSAQLPAPVDVLDRLRSDISDPFYDNGPNDKGVAILLWASLQRVASGFALAALVGIPLGLLMGTSTRWWHATNPVVQLLRPISPLAWFPGWAVIFMDADRASVWVIFMTALWPIVSPVENSETDGASGRKSLGESPRSSFA
jgi:nitrate/nitrite transport system permease protein